MDDFSPVLTLGQQNIQVWPIRLPTHITSHEDRELKRNLIELRASAKNKFILHSTRRDIVQHVMLADFEDVIPAEEGAGAWPDLEGNMSRLDLGLALDVVGLLRHVLWLEAGDCNRPPPGSDHHVTADTFKRLLKDKEVTYSGALGEYVWESGENARTNYTMDILAYKDGTKNRIGNVSFVEGLPKVEMVDAPETTSAPHRIFGKDDVLRIVTRQDDPFIIKQGDDYTGFSYDLLVKLAEKLSFSFTISDITERERMCGTLDGMVDELITGNASMAVGALEVTAERETQISFSYTILSTQASVLIKKAKSTQNFFQWLSPFRTDLWMMIIAFIGVAAAALFLISRFDPTQQGAEQRFDLKESVWYAINILLQGSTDYSPQTTSMRAIIAFFWFSVIIIEAAYTANLAAYLTLQQIDNRIKTVHDLAGQTQIKYGAENGSGLMHFFRTQREDPFERMWAFMKINEETSLLSNTTEIIQKVNTGKFAFIADGVTNDYYASQYCGIEAIDQNFGAKDFSFGFPRGAPYRDDINRALLELKEEGVLDDLKKQWWSAGRNCTEDDQTRSVSEETTAELDIANMVGVFIVLATFTFVAIVVDIAERVHRRRKIESPEKENAVVTADGVLENKYVGEYT
nr:hypothetical protein BaRGS_012707 [Batillaria attramentaria]